MKRYIFVLAVAFLVFACNNGDVDNEGEKGPFSLIGTWEAEGEYVVDGDQRTYKFTLTFLNETEYKQEAERKSKNGTFNGTQRFGGTYTYDDNYITYTNTEYNADGSIESGPFTYPHPYKFINKNTLETYGPGTESSYITGVLFKRKN